MAEADRDQVIQAATLLISAAGEKLSREGLKGTPERVARAWEKATSGYGMKPEEILGRQFTAEDYDEMVVLREIEFYSTCEHHLLPFYGQAHVGYLPGKKIVGISKLARLVECFARRLQIQERMTTEIAFAIQDWLDPVGVGVLVEARDLCMMSRGVEKQCSAMVTSCLLGAMREDRASRAEFMRLIGR